MKIRHLKEDGTPKYTNRLISETSPYLLQHAHNPVDWYPWGPAALEKARTERRPVHLSIGYSACHWCHVLAAESFEDEATAQLLNERFVNIKVDREERPDLDRIYQVAQQLITRRPGGWPLTMFLTHEDQRPFFGGTYFPPQARHGLPAFPDVLARVADYYAAHETELREQGAALMDAFAQLADEGEGARGALTAEPIASARRDLAATFDRQFGGFGGAPKFPHPLALERLLRDWHATVRQPQPDLEALYMATLTLRRMGEGGIYDQLAGGFCRYSVDAYWMIPHFEKMLYDNGALLAVYAQAALATGDAFYARIAGETAEFLQREMQGTDGGFYSSFDADSEGHEGKYYVWDRAEIEGALSKEELAVFAPRFGLDRTANFEGHWHLHAYESLEDVAARLGRTPQEATALLDSARRKLLAIRSQRVPPGRDDKVLTAWNALAIRGLAIAARCLARGDLAAGATRALDFVRRTLWHDGRLLATSKDGRAHLNAYLDDYAYLADAVLELQQVRFVGEELEFARELAEVMLAHFADPAGGFYFTSDDHEALILRSKTFSDDATPAGNGIAAFVLQRIGYLLAEPRYVEAAERTLRAAWTALTHHASSHAALLAALEEHLAPPEIIVLRGAAAEIDAWRHELTRLYAPRRLVLAIPDDATHLPPALADKAARDTAVGYICVGSTCSAPVDSLAALVQTLQSARAF
jgi:uncharacterized protein